MVDSPFHKNIWAADSKVANLELYCLGLYPLQSDVRMAVSVCVCVVAISPRVTYTDTAVVAPTETSQERRPRYWSSTMINLRACTRTVKKTSHTLAHRGGCLVFHLRYDGVLSVNHLLNNSTELNRPCSVKWIFLVLQCFYFHNCPLIIYWVYYNLNSISYEL